MLSYQERYNRLWCVEGCLKENVKSVLDQILKELDTDGTPKWEAQVSQSKKQIYDREEDSDKICIPVDDTEQFFE